MLVELLHALVHGDSSEEFRVAWKKLVVNKTPVSDIKVTMQLFYSSRTMM